MRIPTLIASIVCLTAVILSVCAETAFSKDNTGHIAGTIRVNYSPSYASSIQQVIMLKSLLEPYLPEGVTVEWTTVATAPETRDGIVAGSIDIASISCMSVIAALENGFPVVLLSSAASTPINLFSRTPDIKSINDIKRANKISIGAYGSNQHLAFMLACKEIFGNASVFNDKLMQIAEPDAIASLANSDEFDCAISYFPYTLQIAEIPKVKLLLELTPYVQKYGIGSYFFTNKKFYDNNPALIGAFRKAQKDAVDFMTDHPAEAALLLADMYKVEPKFVEDALKTLPPRLEIAGYDNVADLLFEAGILDSPPKKFENLPNYKDIPK
jgi:ABC-type nitrate/sulfonate/bicarbonate transport system substrate-binding protein